MFLRRKKMSEMSFTFSGCTYKDYAFCSILILCFQLTKLNRSTSCWKSVNDEKV